MRCPGPIELARAFSTRDPRVVAHVADCPRCRADWDGAAQVIALGRDLPTAAPGSSQTESLRTSLLAAAAADTSPRHAPRWPWAVAGVLAAAAAVLLLWIDRRRPEAVVVAPPAPRSETPLPPRPAVVVTPDPRAVLERTGDTIRLHEGSLTVIAPGGEHLRVLTTDAELDVHDTRVLVAAEHDRLTGVIVYEGLAELKAPTGSRTVSPADPWQPPRPMVERALPPRPDHRGSGPVPVPSPSRPSPVQDLVPAPQAESVPSRSPPERSPSDLTFESAWSSLRRGDDDTAAEAFARVADGPFAEDAAYWRGVALARAGRHAPAIAALVDFLDRYPASPRAGEASAILGWQFLATDRLDSAEARFRAAEHDPAASVRDSARKGLSEVARRRR